MSREELPEFLKALAETKMDEVTRAALSLTMITAQRTSEIIGATWEEFDLDSGLWRIPCPARPLPSWKPCAR